jgi:hypothetical protein
VFPLFFLTNKIILFFFGDYFLGKESIIPIGSRLRVSGRKRKISNNTQHSLFFPSSEKTKQNKKKKTNESFLSNINQNFLL